MSIATIEKQLGAKAKDLLAHVCKTVPKERLHLPGPDWVDRIFSISDRNVRVLRSLHSLYNHGRLQAPVISQFYLLIKGWNIPQGHLLANPDYFDPENIVKLAIEGGCKAVASTLGVLSSVARKYAHKIPFLLKFNHNELLTYPNKHDQTLFASIKQAYDMGCVAVGATIYFGSEESRRQITEVSQAFAHAHELGMATVLWCYLRNSAFKTATVDYHEASDLTGQANHLGATIGADIVKQKLPENNGGFKALNFGKQTEKMYTELCSDHPIDLCRYQVINGYMGRIGLINSGGPSGQNDLGQAVLTAVINKRAGGMGLISGRKAFQKPMKDGVTLLNAIQDVYLCKEVSIA